MTPYTLIYIIPFALLLTALLIKLWAWLTGPLTADRAGRLSARVRRRMGRNNETLEEVLTEIRDDALRGGFSTLTSRFVGSRDSEKLQSLGYDVRKLSSTLTEITWKKP